MPDLRPPVNHSDPPPWYELSEDLFEDLCCDVHRDRESVTNCVRYGTRFQTQKGIDLLADCVDGSREAAQCKRHKRFAKGNLKQAIDDFWPHLEYWKARRVRLFRIYVATEVRSTTVLNDLLDYQEKFAEHDIQLELRDGRHLSRLLGPHRHRQTVAQFAGLYWADIICGPLQSTTPDNLDRRLRRIEAQFDLGSIPPSGLTDSLSRQVNHRVDDLRERYRRGARRAAQEGLQRITEEDNWPHLSSTVKARTLRLIALYTVNVDGNTSAAREIASRADAGVEDSTSRLLDALMRLKDHGEVPAQTEETGTEISNLRAAALLELGNAEDAIDALAPVGASSITDPESCRLLALAHLIRGELPLARESIGKALEAQPHWLSVRVAEAIIRFWEGAGTEAGSRVNRFLPGPFPAELVRADDAAIRLISEAAAQFAQLAEQTDDLDEQWRLRLWEFICLLSSERRDGAEERCQSLLGDDPGSPMALGWALVRRLPVDRDAALEALAGSTPSQSDYLDRIGLRVGLLLEVGEAETALQVLCDCSERFVEAGEDEALAHWKVQALSALSRYGEAESCLEVVANDESRQRLKLQIERARADETNDQAVLVQTLEDSYQKFGGVDLLLEIVERRLRVGDAESVEGYAEELIRGAPTPSAVRVLARARWATRRPRACLELLDTHLSVFPRRKLPEDLQRLRVHCLQNLGYLNDAIENARLIAQVEGTTEAFLDLLEAQIDHGDLPGVEATGRLILSAEDASQPALLRAAGMVGVSSPELGRQLWQRVVTEGPLEDQLIPVAYTLGNSFSVSDAELAPLVGRISEIAESDSDLVQAFSLQDAVSMMRSAGQHQEEVYAKYGRGEIPVHVMPEAHRLPILAAFSVGSPARAGSLDPFVDLAILARYGRWPLRASTPLRGVLLLDVTSLVVAASLGVLEYIVSAFDSVLIPRATQRLLIYEISRLRPQQPQRSAAAARALERIRSGGISVVPEPIPWSADKATSARMGVPWVVRSEAICAEGALLVEFLPLAAHDGQSAPLQIPAALMGSMTSPRLVAAALRDGGAISETDLQERVAWMGSSAGPGAGAAQPHRGQRVFLSSVIAVLLSEVDLLNTCCDYFDVAMYADERDQLEAEVASDTRREAIADWGQTLVGEIQRRLNEGSLAFISPTEGGDSALSRESLTIDCLLDLFQTDIDSGLACCDDRFVNSHSMIGRLPSTSIPDLIAALRKNGQLSRRSYFGAIDQMRRANLRFVPISGEEIMYWLRKSRVRRGLVAESEQLATLRSRWAGCCSRSSALQKAGEGPDGSSEAAFLLNCRRAVADAIQEIWSDRRTSPETRKARSRWLLDSLSVGLVEIQHHMPDTEGGVGERAPVLAGVDIALLSATALSLDWTQPPEGEAESAAAAYLGWLAKNYVEPILAIDRHLSEPAAARIRDFLLEMLSDTPGKAERRAILPLLKRFVGRLPDALREELGKDQSIERIFGLRSYEVVKVGAHSFEFEEFWESAASAVNRERGRVQPLEGGYYLSLVRSETVADEPRIDLKRADSSVETTISNPVLGTLSAARSERIAALDKTSHWTDGDPRSNAEIADELERLSPIERVEMIQSLSGRSAADHYQRLESELQAEHRLSIDHIAPRDLDRIATYFRLAAEGQAERDFNELWASAAESLVSEFGLVHALDRVLCIPSRVPQPVVDQLDKLGDAEAEAVLRGQYARAYCPISLLNLLSISARTTLDGPWRSSFGGEVVSRLGGADLHPDFEFTKAIAARLEERIAAVDASPSEMKPEVQLAVIWGHAAKVVNLVRRTAAASDSVTAWIRQSSTEATSLFRPNRVVWRDFWGPNRIAAAHLLFDGVASASQGHEIEEIKDRLEPLAVLLREFPDADAAWMIRVLADPSLRTDLLSSGMTRGREHFVETFGEDTARFMSAELEQRTERAISLLETDPTAPEPWMQIAAVVGDLPIYPLLRERFKQVIEGVSLVALRRDNWSPLILALSIRAAAASAEGTESTILAFVAELEDVLRRLERTENGEEERRVLEQIVEAAYGACLGLADRGELRRAFFSNLMRLFACSRRLCELMVPSIIGLRGNLPSDLRTELSELLFVCRGRARPGTFK